MGRGASESGLTPEERFWLRVNKLGPDECWPWRGAQATKGYGFFYAGGKKIHATRFSWSLNNGLEWPVGLICCHSCDNPPCVNPSHLWAGTIRDNAIDMSRKGRSQWSQKTHCPSGHPYEGENLLTYRGARECRVCANASKRRYFSTPEGKARKKAWADKKRQEYAS